MKKTGLADSPFFHRSPAPPEAKTPVETSHNSDIRSPERLHDEVSRTPVRVFDRSESPRRVIKRHSFEIYEDQLETLKRLKGEALLKNQTVNMSVIVRAALDQYLQKERE